MRKFFLLVMALMASMAMMAGSALADESPIDPEVTGTIESEATGELCPDNVTVVSHTGQGGCRVHASGSAVELVAHLPFFGEIVGTRCDNEFVAHVGPDGEGVIAMNDTSITHTTEGQTLNCGRAEDGVDRCSEASAAAVGDHSADWHLQAYEDHIDGSEWLRVGLCVENTTLGTVAGDLWVHAVRNATGSIASFEAEDQFLDNVEGPSNPVSFTGHWTVEPSDELLAHH